MNNPRPVTAASTDAFADFILGQLKVAGLRAKLLATEVESIAIALGGNFISAEDAVAWADELSPDLSITST